MGQGTHDLTDILGSGGTFDVPEIKANAAYMQSIHGCNHNMRGNDLLGGGLTSPRAFYYYFLPELIKSFIGLPLKYVTSRSFSV